MIQLPFADREEAGRMLADHLGFHKPSDEATVLALPRGGVPVGFAIAEQLHMPLDVLSVRKLGVPWQPELAMGAIAGGVRVLDEDIISELAITGQDIDRIAEREQAEITRREKLYRRGRPPLELAGRAVILVDDGLATGSTMRAAIAALKKLQPAKIVVAVPVAVRSACAELEEEVDEVVCARTPEPFYAVGQWYAEFTQTTDEEVRELLARAEEEMAHPRR